MIAGGPSVRTAGPVATRRVATSPRVSGSARSIARQARPKRSRLPRRHPPGPPRDGNRGRRFPQSALAPAADAPALRTSTRGRSRRSAGPEVKATPAGRRGGRWPRRPRRCRRHRLDARSRHCGARCCAAWRGAAAGRSGRTAGSAASIKGQESSIRSQEEAGPGGPGASLPRWEMSLGGNNESSYLLNWTNCGDCLVEMAPARQLPGRGRRAGRRIVPGRGRSRVSAVPARSSTVSRTVDWAASPHTRMARP